MPSPRAVLRFAKAGERCPPVPGAAGTVTGSKHLLRGARARLLLDCGLVHGLRGLHEGSWAPPPVSPGDLAAILVSHADVEHAGYLPRLVREGFAGSALCERPPAATYLVDGEPRACAVLPAAIERELGWAVRVAADDEPVAV